MESGRIFCLMVLIISKVSCDENTELMFSQIEDINEDMTDMKGDMFQLEKKIMGKIEFAKASLRSEMKQHIKQQVREAMAEILRGESIEEMVRSQVVSEVRKLQHGYHQMKRELHHVVKSIRDVQEDRKLCKESLLKAERNVSEFLTCSKYVVDSKILQRDLEQCNKEMNERNMENQELIRNMMFLNETCQLRLQKVNISSHVTTSVASSSASTVTTTAPTATPKLPLQKVNISSDVTASVESLSVSTVTTTSPTATPKPEEERSRIIVAPYLSSTRQQLRQLNIHSNTLNSYPYLHLKRVMSLAYVSRLKKLLIGLYAPDNIISSNLDSSSVKTMIEGVGSLGMAVDEDRELVFMTTHSPKKSISRMTTHGKHFTTVSDVAGYHELLSIAIDCKEEKIYTCDRYKVFIVTYNGQYIQTLATGSSIRAVTLDTTAGILYYNDEKRLMKISLSDNVSSNVITLFVRVLTLTHYNNTVYFSESGSSGNIGAVRVGYETVSYPLQTASGSGGQGFLICLVL